MNLGQRSYQQELLDFDNIPFNDIKRNMEELNVINTYLGGHKITISGLSQLARTQKNISVCEIGCGGGDNLLALSAWCNSHSITAQFIGIDIKPACIEFANTRQQLRKNTKWIVSDYKEVCFDKKPDIIFSSLFCHHFIDKELVFQVNWMKSNSVLGFFINDLQRNKLAYTSIKILTQLFSKSYLVKSDAPLSVARGFLKSEWQTILNTASIEKYNIQWKWAFRYLIVYQHAE